MGPTPEQLQQQKQAEAEAAAEAARRAARAEAIRRLEELNVLRLEPLGMDRRFNRYWLLCCPDFSITSCYTGSADDPDLSTGSIPGVCECVSVSEDVVSCLPVNDCTPALIATAQNLAEQQLLQLQQNS